MVSTAVLSSHQESPYPGATGTVVAPLTILVAEDNRANWMVLNAMLKQDGHTVLIAENGQEAVAMFQQHQPDMILMDVMMPTMDGYEATRRIKMLAGERFVPVIFLTAMTDAQDLVQCVACGGDDFLTKPYQHAILKAKIAAMQRVRQLYTAVQEQKEALSSHNRRLQREYAVAEKLFTTIVHRGCLDVPYIKYMLSPMAIFNGDLLLAARQPAGGLHIMLGDFTGHGLPAAVGAIPVSDIFYSMTAKGYAISDIVTELNQKLKAILPTGVFCAACLLELDATYSTLAVWNGGLPDILLARPHRGPPRRLKSRHLPLGVVDNLRLDRSIKMVGVVPGERIYAYTDGVIEASNPQGALFGQQRLEASLRQAPHPDRGFEAICNDLKVFCASGPQRDDLTLIEIVCDAMLAEPAHATAVVPRAAPAPLHWQMTLEFGADTLRAVDPLPRIMQTLMEIQTLYEHREHLYTILAELFSNALEHGLLGLDSALKSTPQGFVAYYTAREKNLAALEDGWVKIALTHTALGATGQLTLRVEDSGPGFDYHAYSPELATNTTCSGRGIPLLWALCKALTYYGAGNCAEAVYTWS